MDCPTPDKIEYRSKANALKAQRGRRLPAGVKERLHPYECVGHWHLTHHAPERQSRVFNQDSGGVGLTTIANQFEGLDVRHVLADQPLWIGKDICRIVGISKPYDAFAQLDDDERGSIAVETLGGPQKMVAVTEAGVWSLMLMSRSPKVKPFKRWLTHEVLPSIRKNGRYSSGIALPDRKTMAQWVIDAEDRAALAEAKVEALKPSANAWDTIADSSGDYSVGDAAKLLKNNHGIDVGERKLFDYMSSIGWAYRRGNSWVAYQEHVNNGRLAMRVNKPFWNATRKEFVNGAPTVRVTPKGVRDLLGRLSGQLALT